MVPSSCDPTSPRRLTDPRAMRAVSHPVRLALLEVLTLHGPLTATQAGALIDESSTTCSFHLRQLAKYGFVEEAGGGVGRSRPWRVVQLGFVIDPDLDDAAGQVASQTLSSVVLDRQVSRHEHSRRVRSGYPPKWRDVGWQQETVWWLTREELDAVQVEIDALIHRFVDRLADPARRPKGSMPIEFVALAHMFDAALSEQDAPQPDAETHDVSAAEE